MIKELAKENNYINIFLSLKSVIILHTYISTDISVLLTLFLFFSVFLLIPHCLTIFQNIH